QRLHRDGVEVAPDLASERARLDLPASRSLRRAFPERLHPRAGTRRLDLTELAPHVLGSRGAQLDRAEGKLTGEEVVEEDPQRVDVRPRVDVLAGQVRLLRTHVFRRSDDGAQLGM